MTPQEAARLETVAVYSGRSMQWPTERTKVKIEQAIARGVPADRIPATVGCTWQQYLAVRQAMDDLAGC